MHSSFRVLLASAAILALGGCGRSGDDLTDSSDLSSEMMNGRDNGHGNGNHGNGGNGSGDHGNGGDDCTQGHKVLICHIPPGNPSNAHEICIDRHALAAHKKNHGDNEVDTMGKCPGSGEGDPGEPDAGQPDAGQPDAGPIGIG